MADYSKSRIYKIVCNQTGKKYIGSTVKPLNIRLSEHKSCYKRYLKDRYYYCTSFEIIKNNDYRIELIEEYSCDDRKTLVKKERHYIETSNCVNKRIEGRTMKEYNDHRKEHYKEYRRLNKQKISDYSKQKIKCQCGCTLTRCNISTHKKSKKHLDILKHLDSLNKV